MWADAEPWQGDLALSHARGLIKQEVVFAGWGEPTLRWHVVCEVAEYLRKTNRHVKVRHTALLWTGALEESN